MRVVMADLSGRINSGATTSRILMMMMMGMKTIQRIILKKNAMRRKGKRKSDFTEVEWVMNCEAGWKTRSGMEPPRVLWNQMVRMVEPLRMLTMRTLPLGWVR